MGGLVLLAAIIDLFNSTPAKTILANLYSGIWWRAIMVLTGLVFLYIIKGKVVK
jgi:hypothetical protein